MASYFGGRAEVRVRKVDVPVTVVDFTSMYPTVFLLQNIQQLIGAETNGECDATNAVRKLIRSVTLSSLYDSAVWPQLNCLVCLRPNGDILPVRMRQSASEAYTISVTHFTSDFSRWYTLADVIAAKLLGGKTPEIERAIEIIPGEQTEKQAIDFLGTPLDPLLPIFKIVVEQRQRAKRASNRDPHGNRLGANSL